MRKLTQKVKVDMQVRFRIFGWLVLLIGGCRMGAGESGSNQQNYPCHETDGKSFGYSSSHLTPSGSNESYQKSLVTVFKNSFSPNVELRMLCVPSSFNEWATGIKKGNDGSYYAFFERASYFVWEARYLDFMQAGNVALSLSDSVKWLQKGFPFGPPQLSEISTEYTENRIDETLVKNVREVWVKALSETSYPSIGSNEQGMDGIGYEFWGKFCPATTGSAWSPKTGSRTSLLVNVGFALVQYSKAKKDSLPYYGGKLENSGKLFLSSR